MSCLAHVTLQYDGIHTWICCVPILHSDLTIAIGVGEYDCTNHSLILSIFHFETSERASVFRESNFALKLNA